MDPVSTSVVDGHVTCSGRRVGPSDGGAGDGVVEADRLRIKYYEPFHGVLRQHQHQQTHLSTADTFGTYCPVHASATPPVGGSRECRLPLQGFSCVGATTLPVPNALPSFDAQTAAIIASASSGVDVRSTVDWLTNLGERRVTTTDATTDQDVKDLVKSDWWTRECDCSAPQAAMSASWRRHVAVVADRDRVASQSSSIPSKDIRTSNDNGEILSSLTESLRHIQLPVGQSSPLTATNDLEVLSNGVPLQSPMSSTNAVILSTVSAEVSNGARPDLVATPGGATAN